MEFEERVQAAIVALDKDVCVRMVKLQLLGYRFTFAQSPQIRDNIWVSPYMPSGRHIPATGGHISNLTDVVLRVWNEHVRINNGWPGEAHAASQV